MTKEIKIDILKELIDLVNRRNTNLEQFITIARVKLQPLILDGDDKYNLIPKLGTLDPKQPVELRKQAINILNQLLTQIEPNEKEDSPIYFD